MTDFLIGCRAKIERTEENIKNLSAEITAFLTGNPKPFHIAREFQNGGMQYAFVAFEDVPVPPRLAVLAGEAVHHLHSALDHLVRALVIKQGGTPTRNHHFPICTSAKKFDDARARGAISGISHAAEALIRSVQPYTVQNPDDTVLYVVRQYDNLDKHQLLIVVSTVAQIGREIRIGTPGKSVVAASGRPTTITGLGDPRARRVTKDGVVVFTIDLAEPVPEFEADADFVSDLAFEKCGRVALAPVIRTLTGLLQGTAHTINLFKAEF